MKTFEQFQEAYGGKRVSRKARLASTHPPTAQAAIKDIPVDRAQGSGNKATRRAGGEVEVKSPTYLAHVHNKKKKVTSEEASHGETVGGKFMSYATMRAKGIKPKQTAVQKTRKNIEDTHGKGAIYDPKNPPKSKPRPKPKPDTRTPEQKKAAQHKANMDAVYGGPQRDRGLGT